MSSSFQAKRIASVLRWPASEWRDLATATAELARARAARDRLIAHLPATFAAVPGSSSSSDRHACERVGRALQRAARIVPWQSTCLIQAFAARRWLDRLGIASNIRIGVRKPPGPAIEAHAWVEAGGVTVVGGDTADYSTLAA